MQYFLMRHQRILHYFIFLHIFTLAVNQCGDIIAFSLGQGNEDDRQGLRKMAHWLHDKVYADRGYIGGKIFQELMDKGIMLITRIKKNMKNRLMLMEDKILLRKRTIIETINDFLKNICQIEHSRHRSMTGFIVNLLAGLSAYTFLPNKPAIRSYNLINA